VEEESALELSTCLLIRTRNFFNMKTKKYEEVKKIDEIKSEKRLTEDEGRHYAKIYVFNVCL
jgi:hypothetical protein